MKDEPVPVARVLSLPPERSHGDAGPEGLVVPLYGLYSAGQVAMATFFGTPIAGCWLLARNYKRLGQAGVGWLCVVLGVLFVTGEIVLAFADKLPGLVSLATIPAMWGIARALQGREFDRHVDVGGRRISSWIAFGSAMAWLGIVFALAVGGGVLYLLTNEAPFVEPKPGSDVRYVDGATESDAQRVSAALVELKYFDGDPATVQVHREPGRVIVTFVVQAAAFLDRQYHDGYAAYAEHLAKALDGTPVDVALADAELRPRERFRWEMRPRSVTVGDDTVHFRDGIEEKEARAVLRILDERKFVREDGVVSLTRRGRVVLTAEVPVQLPDRPLLVTMWHNLAHALSRDALAGSPIDIQLEVGGKPARKLTWEDRPPESINLSDGHEIQYRDGGTLEEAKGVAGVAGTYFKEHGGVTSIVVSRDAAADPPRAVVAFYATNPDYNLVAELAAPLSKAVFANQPVDIRLIDDDLQAHTVFAWEKRPKARGAIRPRP